MEASNLKNIIVLKNLPSNIVDEAIIILKTNKILNKHEILEANTNKIPNNSTKKGKGYILKEAEMLLNGYINKIEKAKKDDQKIIKEKEKYKKLKYYAIIITILNIVLFLLNLI